MKSTIADTKGNHPKANNGLWCLYLTLCISALPTISGCATTRELVSHTQPKNGNALVYFIRDSYPPHMREAQLYVNQHQVATMADDDAVAINVPLGNNAILMTINGDKPITFNLPINREETIYIAFTGNVRWTNSYFHATYVTIELTRRVQASRITKEQAMSFPETIRRKLNLN